MRREVPAEVLQAQVDRAYSALAGFLRRAQAFHERAAALHERAAGLHRRLGDESRVRTALGLADNARARAVEEEALGALLHSLGHRRGSAVESGGFPGNYAA